MTEDLSHFQSLVIISGLSGAGKSTTSRAFSDNGYFAIDNLPVALLPNFLEQTRLSPERYAKTSLLIDIDSEEQRDKLFQTLQLTAKASERKETHEAFRLIYLDSTTPTLIKRYSETRRPHPLFNDQADLSISDAIQRERELLQPLKELAHVVIESSELTPHDLRRQVYTLVADFKEAETPKLRISIESFGFKHGVPQDCDLLIDVRFLPNPYFVDELRPKTGLETDVQEHVLQSDESKQFLEKYTDLLQFLLPRYAYEGKAYLKLGVGCTGGKHRSVTIAETLAKQIFSNEVTHSEYSVSVTHRDVHKTRNTQQS